MALLGDKNKSFGSCFIGDLAFLACIFDCFFADGFGTCFAGGGSGEFDEPAASPS